MRLYTRPTRVFHGVRELGSHYQRGTPQALSHSKREKPRA